MPDRRSVWLFAGFMALFSIVFVQFPVKGFLPGNTDTLLAIALSNQIFEKLRLLTMGHFSDPTVLYPVRDVLAYGENCYALAAIFLLFEGITRSEIAGYYLFISFLFTLNGVAVTRLAELVTGRIRWAILAGVVFNLAGFTLGNIDDPNVVFIFFPVMALVYLLRATREKSAKWWIRGCLFTGLQIWFGFYLFAYQAALLLGYFAFEAKSARATLNRRDFAKCLAAFVLPVLPLIFVYAYNYEAAGIVSPYEVFRDCSLTLQDFIQRLPDNLIYPETDRWLDWVEIRKNCFPGLVLPLVSAFGLWRWSTEEDRWKRRQLFFFAIAFAVFLFFAFGANNPLLNGFREIPILNILRVPSRYYLICLLSLSLFFALGAQVIGEKWAWSKGKGLVLVATLSVAFIVENVPFPLFGYEYASIIAPSPTYVAFFSKEEKPKVILDLPSTINFLPTQSVNTADRMWFFTREIVYMNWQTYHRQMIVGGANGYVSRQRTEVENWVRSLPERSAIERLKAFGVTHVVFHKKMVLFPDEEILDRLKASGDLRLKLEDEGEAIFEIGL